MAEFNATIPRSFRAPVLDGILPVWLGEMFLGQERATRLDLDAALETSAPKGRPQLDVVLPEALLLKRAIRVANLKPKDWASVARLDLTNKTPFAEADVVWALDAGATDGAVTQWVAKRADLDGLRSQLAAKGWKPRKFLVATTAGDLSLYIESGATGKRPLRRLNAVLLVASLAAGGYAWLAPSLQAREDTRVLNMQIADMRLQTVSLRADLDRVRTENAERAAFLANVANQTRVVSLLRDTTVNLPDDAWLGEWRYGPNGLKLIGETSGSAADLVLHLSQNVKGWTPALSGAVSRSPNGAERFNIDVSLAESSTGGDP